MNEGALIEAIEAFLVRGPAPSRHLRYLDVEGVTASMGPNALPASNRIGLTEVAPAAADALVRRIATTYRAEARGARWYVTPRSRPTDLGRRLEREGLRHEASADLVGLALALDRETAADRAGEPVRDVRSVGLDELRRHVDVMAEGFGASREEELGVLDMLAAGAVTGCRFVHYLAYEDDVPVAFGSSLEDAHRRVTLLGGSAVVPAARGRGHYRALVRARIADARRHGSEAVVVQASPRTSAPILTRLGFVQVTTIAAYDLAPPTAEPVASGGAAAAADDAAAPTA